ncbi:MAG: SGNH/GDSL hydrolase family protein [Oscillospiraceae bacterium]|nr:SGNH/GDSL hydrolase family protein [Oscillospiraceae bacterium]
MKRILPILILFALLLTACAAPAEPVNDEPSEPPVLERLEIVSYPDRTEYAAGEIFDPTGLVVNAIMSDGSVQENVEWSSEETVIVNRMESVKVECLGKKLTIPVKVYLAGNAEEYSVANTATVENSPVKGNTYFWLGSSVTFGASSEEESMVDFFAKKWDCTCIKEAVSGTKLTAAASQSYVERFNKYLESADRAEHLDGFICQLSTNDTSDPKGFGMVMPDMITDYTYFDTATTFGAMEYIAAKVKEVWGCPVYFYTNPPFGNANYVPMVEALELMAPKWDITIIDMYRDEEFNAITDAERALYMADTIHPTKAGYRDWWLPKFEEAIIK